MVIVLGILIIILILYIIILQQQMRHINKQLIKRLNEKTRQPISLLLINRELNEIAININNCLKEEEKLRLESIHDENKFKEMIANISHDFRTPITAIKGYQQLLQKDELAKEQREKLNVAQKHADALGNLIDQFFAYSYFLYAKPIVYIEKINLTNLVAECLADSVQILAEKNLMVNFNETLPVFIQADKDMTIRVIQNLIRNASEHSDSDIEVKINSNNNASLLFCNGIPKDMEIDANQIFDRFYTGDKARSKTTGLGLSIVKLLVEEMGGSSSASIEKGYLKIQVEFPLYKQDIMLP